MEGQKPITRERERERNRVFVSKTNFLRDHKVYLILTLTKIKHLLKKKK